LHISVKFTTFATSKQTIYIYNMVDLKKNITSHGVTLVELAQRMGTSQQAVSQAVHGNPSLSYLQRMADAVGIPLSELVNDIPTDQAEPLMHCPHCGEPIKVTIE